MHGIQALSDYLCLQFHWCKDGQFHFEPEQKTLYIDCQPLSQPEILLQEAETISRLDIGVKRFVITVPNLMDLVIECQPVQNRDRF